MIDTPRLLLRPVTSDDFDYVYRMQSDPDMMRYIRAAEKDPAVIRERMNMWLDYMRENPGLGVFTGILKASGQPVSTGVLRHVDYTPGNELELGYMIAPDYWGQGLATEITRALMEYAFGHFPDDKLVAVTAPENMASQRVLLKCGFALAGKRFIYEGECLEFVCRRQKTPNIL